MLEKDVNSNIIVFHDYTIKHTKLWTPNQVHTNKYILYTFIQSAQCRLGGRYTQQPYAVSSTTIPKNNNKTEQNVRSTDYVTVSDCCHIFLSITWWNLSLSVSGNCIMLQIWCIKFQTFKCKPNIIFPFNKKKEKKKKKIWVRY